MDKAKIGLIMRVLLGLIFVVFGLNGFLQFMQMPPIPQQGMAFLTGLMAAPYFFLILKLTEIICGALILAGLFVPLSLVILAPIVLNIVLFHAFLAPGGLMIALLVLVLELGVAYMYKDSFSELLEKKADIS